MGPTGNDINVIQIHPNLSCKHCYSSSGPEGFYELPIDAAADYLPFLIGMVLRRLAAIILPQLPVTASICRHSKASTLIT